MSDNPVTSVMVRESFMFAQLSATGRDTNEVGTTFTAAKSRAFDVWLEAVKREAFGDGISYTLNPLGHDE